MRKTSLLAGAALLAAGAIYAGGNVAWSSLLPASQPDATPMATGDTQTVEVSTSTGSLYRGGSANNGSQWSSQWVSSATKGPRVKLTNNAGKNNFLYANGKIQVMLGDGNAPAAAGTTLSVEPADTWYISSVELKFVEESSTPITITMGGKSMVTSSQEQTLAVDFAEGDTPSWTLTSSLSGKEANHGFYVNSFRVTCTRKAGAPAEDESDESDDPMKTTTISGNRFAESTVWYLMRIGNGGLIIGDNGAESFISLNESESDLDDSDLWAFTGNASDGYTIYNKAVGTSKVLAAPKAMLGQTGAESFAILKAPGDPDYCYAWDFTPSTNIAGGWYVNQHGEPAKKLNNRNNKLAFWNAGQDAGSTIVLTPASDYVKPLGKVVMRSGGDAAHSVPYRIPAITTVGEGAHKGRVIALADYRYSGADIGNGRIDLYQSISEDNGATWSTPDHMRDAQGQPVAQGTGKGTIETSLENPDCGFGDPCVVADRESQRVLVISVCGRTPFWSGRRNNPNQIARWYSEDGGDTWSHYENITELIYSLFDGTVERGFIDSMFFGSGRIMQSHYIKKGKYYRLYAVMSGYHAASGNVSNWVLYSDDFGDSWAILGDPKTPAVTAGGDEPKAEELPGGSVLLAARGNGGGRNFNIFTFEPGSDTEGTWAKHVNTNLNNPNGINACNGEIMILPVENKAGEKAYIALQSYPFGPGRAKVGMSWKILSGKDLLSPNDFVADWEGHFAISEISSAYSTMTLMDNGHIGFLYEEDRYGKAYCIVFRDLTIDAITDGKWQITTDPDLKIANGIVEQVNVAKIEKYLELEAGEYVGMLTQKAVDAVKAAARAYLADRTDEKLAAFYDVLAHDGAEYLGIVPGVKYRMWNCGRTPNEPRYMTLDGSVLGVTTTPDEDCDWEFVKVDSRAADADEYFVMHSNTGNYIGRTGANETRVPVVEDIDEAYTYTIATDNEGFSALHCTDPTNKPALHLAGDNTRIVPWDAVKGNNNPSFWYMTPDDPEKATVSGIDDVIFDAASQLPAQYYDLQGRPVAAPIRGRVYITSDRRKVLVL